MVAKTMKRRAPPERPSTSQPYEQGDLDGLCGVYTIINAIHVLNLDLTRPKARRLFAFLLRSLRPYDRSPTPIAAKGITHEPFLGLIRCAGHFTHDNLGGQLVVWRHPKAEGQRWTIGRLWRLLEDRLGLGAIAVIGLGGRYQHWTLAVKVTPRTIRLIDSDGLKLLRRAECGASDRTTTTARHVIRREDVVFLRWRPSRPR